LSSLELIDVPAVISLTSSLSVPSGNKFVNSLIVASVYDEVHGVAGQIIDLPSTASELLQEFSECDHRKALYVRAALWDANFVMTSNFGCLGQARIVGVTSLFEIRQNIDRFDHGRFMQVRKHFPYFLNSSLY
jgi:hypothetical protein